MPHIAKEKILPFEYKELFDLVMKDKITHKMKDWSQNE